MPSKLGLSDYDPVSNPRSSESSTEESVRDAWEGFARRNSKDVSGENLSFSGSENQSSTFPDSNTSDQGGLGYLRREEVNTGKDCESFSRSPTSPVAAGAVPQASKDSLILKRGHALSFAGLFLFTFVLYFRPYEFFPALSWMTTIAFWIAFSTLAIFVPTQLGLEGSITSRPREVILILLLVVTALLSIPFALDHWVAWGNFTEYLKVVVMFIVMVNVVRTEKRLRALLLLGLAAGCFLSVGAINDYRLGNLGLEGRRIAGIIGGIFENPNDLALHLVTMIPISVGLMFATRSFLKKGAYILCSLLMVLGVIVTLSRGGFLALVGSISFLIWKLTPRGRPVVVVLGLLAILAMVSIAPSAFRSRISTTQDESAMARFDDLKRSVFLMVRHPLLGVGMGNYSLYSNRAKATHNSYTQVGAEMGIAAALIYLLFVVAPLKPLRRIELEHFGMKKKPRFYYLAIALQASLIGYMLASFFASVAYLWYVYYLVAYALCLRQIYQAQSQNANSAVTISRK
jgi:O-antigen ligase